MVSFASLFGATTAHFTWLLGSRIVEGSGLLLVVLPASGLIRRHTSQAMLSQRMGWWSAYMPLVVCLHATRQCHRTGAWTMDTNGS